METGNRIVKHTQIVEKPYIFKDQVPLEYEQVERLTMEEIERDLEESAYRYGYSQAQKNFKTGVDGVALKISQLKKEILSMVEELRVYENRPKN